MAIFDKVISIIAPHQCLSCGLEGAVLCVTCQQLVQPLPERCWRCHKISQASRTCPGCRRTSPLRRVVAATNYEGLAKELVQALKFNGVRTAANSMATLMAPLLSALSPGEVTYLVHVPTASQRARQRGYDQAELLARALSRSSGIQSLILLGRRGHTRQVGTKRAERLTQLQTAFYPRRELAIAGAHIILVDDVLTTGATLEAAARTLKAAGATGVDAIVFAQA